MREREGAETDDRDGEHGRGGIANRGVHVVEPHQQAREASLRDAVDTIEDGVEEAIGHMARTVCEKAVEDALDVTVTRHAGFPPMAITRASASSAARIARWAWWSRERTVPTGMPRISAISARSRP